MLAATVDGLRWSASTPRTAASSDSPFYDGQAGLVRAAGALDPRRVRGRPRRRRRSSSAATSTSPRPTPTSGIADAAHGGTHVSEPERAAFRALLEPGLVGRLPGAPRRARAVHVVGLPRGHVPQELRDADRPPAASAPAVAARIVDAEIDREARKGPPVPSDHAPLSIDLDEPGKPFDPDWEGALAADREAHAADRRADGRAVRRGRATCVSRRSCGAGSSRPRRPASGPGGSPSNEPTISTSSPRSRRAELARSDVVGGIADPDLAIADGERWTPLAGGLSNVRGAAAPLARAPGSTDAAAAASGAASRSLSTGAGAALAAIVDAAAPSRRGPPAACAAAAGAAAPRPCGPAWTSACFRRRRRRRVRAAASPAGESGRP